MLKVAGDSDHAGGNGVGVGVDIDSTSSRFSDENR